MPRYAYDRLTALDNSFLLLEKPNAYMHVAATQIFKTGPLRTEGGGVDAARIRKLVAALLHRIPRYRQKLAWIPFENHPVWVDDENFNLDFHLRHTALPRPGTEEQLKRLSARVMQQHLDRERPLWEMWIVEGLEDDRFAIDLEDAPLHDRRHLGRRHHARADVARARRPSCPRSRAGCRGPAPSAFELLAPRARAPRLAAVRDRCAAPRAWCAPPRTCASTSRPACARSPRRSAAACACRRRRRSTARSARTAASTGWCSDLGDLKQMRKALGGSLNDLVLTIVTGAVRSFLRGAAREPRPARLPRDGAGVACAATTSAARSATACRRGSCRCRSTSPTRARSSRAIIEKTTRLKESNSAVGAEVLTQAAEYTPSTLLALGARNIARLLPFNLVVTNVPGPQAPMYMLGARDDRGATRTCRSPTGSASASR